MVLRVEPACPPADEPASASALVLVPCCHVGAGTGTASVLDVRTRRTVRLTRPPLVLGPGGVVCVWAESLREEAGQHLVRLTPGVTAWVVPVPDAPPAGGSAA